MATQAEVLQKVSDYCTEKQYTLNDDFRSKFSEKFAGAYADADVNDEKTLDHIKFNLDTAFSAVSKEIKLKDETWKVKESDYLKQIEEFKKNAGKPNNAKAEPNFDLSEDVKKDLEFARQLREERLIEDKQREISQIATKNLGQEQKNGFCAFLKTQHIDFNKDSSELAESYLSTYTDIMKEMIGINKPFSSGGSSSGEKYNQIWEKQAERIKNS